MAKNQKNLVKSIILIVLGVVSILAFFVTPFFKATSEAMGQTDTVNFNMFGVHKEDGVTSKVKDALDAINKSNANTAFNLVKIFSIVAIVLLIAIAVFEILKFAKIDLGKIEVFLGYALLVVTLLVLVFAIAFFCGSTSKQSMGGFNFKVFFSTGISFYFVLVPGFVSGAIVSVAK